MINALLAFSLLLVINAAMAGQLTSKIENDGAFGDDGHYTSGLYLTWENTASPWHKFKRSTPLILQLQHYFLLPNDNSQSAYSLMLSQRMWTPSYIRTPEPQTYDRPYAGIMELTSSSFSYSASLSQATWLAIGVTGPASIAGQLQVLFHKTIGSAPAQGWDTQLEQQITWQAGYNIEKLITRQSVIKDWQWDLSGSGLIDIGSFRTEAFAGLTLRLGQRLNTTFGRINNRYGNTGNLVDTVTQQTLILYARAQLGYRYSDITLEGDFPYNSPIVRNPEQQKYTAGIQWLYQRILLDFSINTYTKDFPSDHDYWHGYGGFSLAVRF